MLSSKKLLKSCTDFLESFQEINERAEVSCNKTNILLRKNKKSKASSYFLLKEFEGESIDYVLKVLKNNDCPLILQLAIARKVTNELSNSSQLENLVVMNKEEKILSRNSLYPIIKKYINEVCLAWKMNSSFENISFQVPLMSDWCIKNTRRTMEDRHNVFSSLNILHDLKEQHNIQMYAVFDGHAGVEAAEYASKHLHVKLVNHASFPIDIPVCLKDCLKTVDEEFCMSAKNEVIKSGCTAVVVVIYNDYLYLSWLGDSQACIVNNGIGKSLMVAHKPARTDERMRIEQAGGCVLNFGGWRVNGQLAVSRAIGDYEFKPYVCSDADVTTYKISSNDDYIIIACDGFWDVYKDKDVPKLVWEYLSKGGEKCKISQNLCTLAAKNGSQDNISVIVVFLREKITSEEELNDELSKVSINEGNEELKSSGNKKSSTKHKDKSNNIVGSNVNVDILIKGNKLEPCEKLEIPHRSLYNYIVSNNKPQEILATC